MTLNVTGEIIILKMAASESNFKVLLDLIIDTFIIDAIISLISRDVMVIVVGNGHDGTSSIPGRDWLHFT